MFGVPYHFIIAHFPIVLMIAAFFYDWKRSYDVGYRLTLGAAASGAFALITGLMLSGGRLSDLTLHAGAGLTGSLAAVGFGVLRYSARARDSEERSMPTAWLAIELVAVVAILVAAFSGHRAVLGF